MHVCRGRTCPSTHPIEARLKLSSKYLVCAVENSHMMCMCRDSWRENGVSTFEQFQPKGKERHGRCDWLNGGRDPS